MKVASFAERKATLIDSPVLGGVFSVGERAGRAVRLLTLVPIARETLQDIIRSLTATGQVVVLKVNGQMVYRAAW